MPSSVPRSVTIIGCRISKRFWIAPKFILVFAGLRPSAVLGPLLTDCMKTFGCLVCLAAQNRIPSLITFSVLCYGNWPGKFVLLKRAALSLADCVSRLPQRTNFTGLPLFMVSFALAKMILPVSLLLRSPTHRPLYSLGLLASPGQFHQSLADLLSSASWSLT